MSLARVEVERLDHAIDRQWASQWLDEYLVEEVLDALPEDLRRFVLQAASLGSLEPELYDAVLDIDRSARFIAEISDRLLVAETANLSDANRRSSSTGTPVRVLVDLIGRVPGPGRRGV